MVCLHTWREITSFSFDVYTHKLLVLDTCIHARFRNATCSESQLYFLIRKIRLIIYGETVNTNIIFENESSKVFKTFYLTLYVLNMLRKKINLFIISNMSKETLFQ